MTSVILVRLKYAREKPRSIYKCTTSFSEYSRGGGFFGVVGIIKSGDVDVAEGLAGDLLAYCGLDTLAMVRLLEVLEKQIRD